MNEEHKRKIGFANKGKIISYEQRKKISEGVKKSLTPEVRLKMSIAAKNRSKNNTGFKKGHTINLGRKFGKEQGRKISEARKGMKFTEEHKRNISIGKKGQVSPRKGYKMTPEELEKHKLINLGRKASEETKNKMSEAYKKHNTPEYRKKLSEAHKGHKSYLPKDYKHNDEVKKKISKAARKNWTKKEFREKCLGRNQFKKSYMENKLYNLIKKVYPSVQDNFVIQTKDWARFPDCYIPEEKIIIEYDGKRWHKLESDKNRDKELIQQGYKIIHYQGYIPAINEFVSDLNDIKNMNYKYKRDCIDITLNINKCNTYREIEEMIKNGI